MKMGILYRLKKFMTQVSINYNINLHNLIEKQSKFSSIDEDSERSHSSTKK